VRPPPKVWKAGEVDAAVEDAGTDGRATAVAERLWPAWWMWVCVLGLAASVGVVVSRLGTTPALLAFVAAGALFTALLLAAAPTVAVRQGFFLAGRAQVPLALVGRVEVLDAASMRRALGPGLDARAFLCIRGWIGTGLRLEIVDPADPTPSWVVSSRRPQALAAAVDAARR
jgi:hypothetical protein